MRQVFTQDQRYSGPFHNELEVHILPLYLSFCVIQTELANSPHLPNLSAKLKKNYGCQMATHLSISVGLIA